MADPDPPKIEPGGSGRLVYDKAAKVIRREAVTIPPVTQEPLVHVDATPDADYVVRILRAHRASCDVRWADHAGMEEMVHPTLAKMNDACRRRAELLNAAIKKLAAP